MQTKNRKRKIVTFVGYSLFILLWLIVICFSLELWERLRWKHIEKTNKFVRIRKGELLMKEWDGEQEEGIHYGEGKHLFLPQQILVGDEWCEPEPDPLELWSYRLQFYFSEDTLFQSAFRTIYNLSQFRVEGNKDSQEVLCSAISDDVDKNKLPLFQSVISNIPKNKFFTELAFLQEGNIEGKQYRFFFYPIWENKGSYVYHTFAYPYRGSEDYLNPALEKAPANNLWEINYFCYIPHINSTQMPFRINNFGFRDRDFKIPKEEGVFRILCIGASTTEEGNTNTETYPKFLEQELRKHFGENRIEVFNCGVSGMILKKHCAKLPDYLYLQPDMVILYEGINDIVYEIFPHSFYNKPVSIRLAFLLSHFARRQMRFLFNYSQEELEKHIQENIFEYIVYLRDVFLSRNIDICISSVGVPYRDKLNKVERDYYDFYYDKEWGWANSTFQQYCDIMEIYNQMLKNYCEKNAILYIPVAENIPASAKYYGDICHMRQAGIKLKAKIMAETLIPYLEQILGKPENPTH